MGPQSPAATLTSPGLLERRPGFAAAALFAALTAVFFAPTFGRDFIFRDAYHEIYPMMLMWGWADGLLPPLWNPYVNLGAPVAGSVAHGVFYPPLWFMLGALRLPPSLVMNLFIYFHCWLAAMGAWALGRALGGRTAGPAAAGVSYAFGGYLVSMHYAKNLLPGFGLAPLGLALLIRARREGRAGLAAAAGACLGLAFLGGDPQAFAIVFIAGPAVALLLVPRGEATGTKWKAAAATALFWAAAVFTSAAELLPALVNLSSLGRGAGFGDLALSWSFHPARLAEFFSAGLFGRAWPVNRYWGVFNAGPGFSLPMALSCYLGAWTMVGAVAAFTSRLLRRTAVVLGAVAALALLLALGGHTPLYPFLLEHVPGFGILRYPEKYLVWVALSAALLAGAGTEAALAEPRARRVAFISAVGFAVALVLAAVLVRLFADLSAYGDHFAPPPAENVRTLAAALGRAGALFGLCAAAAYFLGRDPRRLTLFPALFLFVDLFAAGRPLLMAEPGFYAAPSRFAAAIAAREKNLSSDGPCRLAGGRPCLGLGSYRIFRDNSIASPPEVADVVEGHELIDQVRLRRWERDTLKPNLAVLDGIEEFAGMNVASSAAFDAFMNRTSLDALPRFNVKYAIIPTEQEQPGAGCTVIDRFGGTSLVAFEQAWPRAYFAPDSAVRVVQSRTSSTWYPAEEVGWADPPSTPPPAALVTEYSPDRVTVEVDAPGPGWLVLNDAYSPFWICNRRYVVRFEKLVRAVKVSTGRSRITFDYQPDGLNAGLALSALGLLAGLAGLFVRR